MKGLNVFVASRMKNIVERKAVIDIIHTLGHTPIFIEAEQMQQGEESVNLMLSMIERADRLIAIVDDHLGFSDKNLDYKAPLVFELNEFSKKITTTLSKSDSKEKFAIIFKRKAFDEANRNHDIENVLSLLRDANKKYIEFYDFADYDDLSAMAHKQISKLWKSVDPVLRKGINLSINWHGNNKPGMLSSITELLFSKFHHNVNFVSGSSVNEKASIVITAVPWDDDEIAKIGEIREIIKEEISDSSIEIEEFTDDEASRPKYYVEIRVLDVPGVLNTLCKVLNDQELDILDIRQRPSYGNHKRQSQIVLILAPCNSNTHDPQEIYLKIESRLRNLVGVRSISSSFLNPKEKATETISHLE